MSIPGGSLETLGWLTVIAALAAFTLAAVTVTVLAVRAVRRRRSIRAIRAIGYAAGEGLIRPDELQRYGDMLRANVEYPDDENGHEGKGAA